MRSLSTEANHLGFTKSSTQGRIFIFGALGYFKMGAPLKGLRRLMSYKSALRVLATVIEQVVPIHNHSDLKPPNKTSTPQIKI